MMCAASWLHGLLILPQPLYSRELLDWTSFGQFAGVGDSA
jgi:hypothetical protein